MVDKRVWNQPPSRIPSLDGMRAVSIGLVIVFHIVGMVPFGGALSNLGNLGVRVFFVISGFLITGLLLQEQDRIGTIALGRFYARRTLRIFPAFYLFLAVIGICAAAGWIALHKFELLQAALYIMNYFPGLQQSRYVKHLWSLSVEEQFYLLWPSVLAFAGRRRGLMIAAAFILIAPVLRLTYWFFVPQMHEVMDRRFETVGDALATGCVLAGAQTWLASKTRYNQFLLSAVFYIVPLLVFLDSVYLSPHPRAFYGIGVTILNVGIALCIDRWVRYPQGVAAAVLNSAPLRAIGVLSYSIYLWQQPFLDSEGDTPFSWLPLNLLAVAACSLGSFFLIEQPFQRLRSRLSPRSARLSV
ncbi:MAG TPA: acyltransferase [Bryobacteraceae bacterium]|nr:acyltransferase [Bryobacteraceae bacterium]